MGIFCSQSSQSTEDLEITDNKIGYLNHEINTFMNKQSESIKQIFTDNNYKKQNIDYIFNANDKPQIKESLEALTDYVINWSIEDNNIYNSTNCQLFLFNIGSFLGANGFLYSISLFYYYFMKIPTDNRADDEIKKDINDCLNYIDEGSIEKLNKKWNVNLEDNYLNNLRFAKDFLTNLFQEKATDGIFQRINNNNIKKIWKNVKTQFTHFCAIIYYFLTEKLSLRDFVQKKKIINRNYLITEILKNLKVETFRDKNIYIIATDNNINSLKNLGATFTGFYLKGLGELHHARRLVENEEDGFITGNNAANIKNKKLYDFYYARIKDINLFFQRNQERINRINKGGMDLEINFKEIAKELDMVNEKYPNDALIDNEPLTNISTPRETIISGVEQARIQENENAYIQLKNSYYDEDVPLKNQSNNLTTRQSILLEMGPNRLKEYDNIKKELSNYNPIKVEATPLGNNQNLEKNNSFVHEKSENEKEARERNTELICC